MTIKFHKYFFFILILISCFFYTCHSTKKTTAALSSSVQGLFGKTSSKYNIRFFVVGDWGRNGTHHQKEVAEQMNETGKIVVPDFIVSTGDNFYPNGVASVKDKQWLTSFENIYNGQYLQCKWYPVLGNHDYRGNPQAEINYSKTSTRWSMPYRYYTFSQKINDTTSVRFIFLDTQELLTTYDYSTPVFDTLQQIKWLDSVLIHAKDKWKIVVAHHPIYSSNPRHGNSKKLIGLLKPRLEKHNVQLYLSGHDHDLQHQKPKGATDYIISGAGSQTRKTAVDTHTKFAKDISGFATVSINSDSLSLHFIDYKGNLLYAYNRGK